MGYEMNSPVKQVWLPLDYSFLSETLSDDGKTFGVFAEKYKDKYGIDLHDIFELHRTDSDYSVASTVDVLSAYSIGKFNDSYYTKIASFNAISRIASAQQTADLKLLMGISVEVTHNSENGQGFNILLPKTGTPVNSIDDLQVTLFEI